MSRQPGVRRREWRSGTATWEARWYDSSGKRHTANFATAAEAEVYRQERQRERRYGRTGDPTACNRRHTRRSTEIINTGSGAAERHQKATQNPVSGGQEGCLTNVRGLIAS